MIVGRIVYAGSKLALSNQWKNTALWELCAVEGKVDVDLEVRAKLDTNAYPPGAKVSKEEIAEINIRPDSFHGEWNYTICPNSAVT